jgi:2-keto-4-pentenoate hydratase/2-oxohepta-3-ene-1,7-dioic acid hydratase in catechol pathway
MKLYRIASSRGPAWAREEAPGRLRLLTGDPWTGTADMDETTPLAEARLLAPAMPSKIVAIGLNYKDHAAERGRPVPAEPLLFLKPESAVIGPGAPIAIPEWAGRIDHEAELGIVIGRETKDLASPEAARGSILGAVCVNDVTARELQDKDVQFTRAKGFDTFCPIGPCLVTELPLDDLAVRCLVNGQVKQSSRTSQLIFPPDYLVWFVSRVMTLRPGDIISTGTPAGIGPIVPGDVVAIEVEGVGVLTNPVTRR